MKKIDAKVLTLIAGAVLFVASFLFLAEAKSVLGKIESQSYTVAGDSLSFADAVMLGVNAYQNFGNMPKEQLPNGGKLTKNDFVIEAMRVRFTQEQSKRFAQIVQPLLTPPQIKPDTTQGK